uniref:Ig-like domain-containing protein n=1 Tax=Parascaris equorum TaxID=6256 RepID=A0A914RZ81_PAREQ
MSRSANSFLTVAQGRNCKLRRRIRNTQDVLPVITEHPLDTRQALIASFFKLVHSSCSELTTVHADSGTYYCVAKNKYGEARSREASLKIAMLRDDFRTRPRTTQAVIGNRAVMECVPPKGFPEPVQRSDAGLYQCVATNMVGEKVSSPARLSVYEKPYFQVGNFFTSFPHISSEA